MSKSDRLSRNRTGKQQTTNDEKRKGIRKYQEGKKSGVDRQATDYDANLVPQKVRDDLVDQPKKGGR